MSAPIKYKSLVERKNEQLPRFVVIPRKRLEIWSLSGTTVVEITVNGIELGRRTLKRWDDNRWFIDLTHSQCQRAGIDTGDSITLIMVKASEALPKELANLIADDADAKRTWESLTPSGKRMLTEHILSAKQSETRLRRAVKALVNP